MKFNDDISTSGPVASQDVNISDHFTGYKELPSNGYSRLFRAQRYGQWYMLKSLKPEYAADPQYTAMLAKEFALTVELNHPNIVRALNHEQDAVVGDCIVMEYVDGRTLDDFLKENPSQEVRKLVVKELLFQYTIARAKALNSQAMMANAWHHRSDALSSIATAIGIGGAILLGDRWTILDPIASMIVGVMLVKVAIELLKTSVGELTDSSLPEETEKEIENIIMEFPDVTEPHNLRTRRIGNRIAIETHIRMDGNLSLHESHERATAIERKLKQRFGGKTHVTIHVEPKKN